MRNNFPPILEHTKRVYKAWILIERNLPRCERFGIGQKIDFLFIGLLDILQKTSFSPINLKIPLLNQAQTKIDSLRFFIQLCWEIKLISSKQFTAIGQQVEQIGKMIGGWRKDLIKTSD